MRRLAIALSLIIVAALFLSACAAPEPEVVEKVVKETVVVEKEVEKIITEVVEVEKEVEKIITEVVEVEKEVEVEKVVTATPEPGGPKTGGRVVVAHRQEPDRFWPPISGLSVAHEVGGAMNHPLVSINDQSEYFPILVEEVPTVENGGISEDSLTWTLKLRDDVTWHDGEPFTSEDVKFTYDMIMMEGTDVTSRVGWDRIESVETPDDQTVVITFSEVDAPFLWRLTRTHILPAHILGGLTAEEFNAAEWFRAPVGTGPFMFKEWVAGDHVTLVKNPNYFVEGQPYLDEVVYRIVPDANTLLNMTETGEVDVQFRVQDDLAELLDDMPDVDRVTVQSVTPWLLWINNNHPLFKDVRTRQALAQAFDKEIIARGIFRNLSEVADGVISPQLPAYNPDIVKYRYDPEAAAALLDEVGWRDEDGDGVREAHGVEGVEEGTPLSFETANIAGEQIRVQLLSLMHAQWKELGIDAEINLVDVGTMFGDMHPNNNFETSYSYIGRYADPDIGALYLDREKFGNNANYVGYSNPEVDDLIVASQQTADQQKRIEYLQEAQAIIAEEVPQIFLAWRANTTAVHERVKGYKPAPATDELWNIAEWYVEE